MEEVILELRNITKTFPGIKALDSVQFSLNRGEIHALMGENGAGKSTLVKIITGVHIPDAGEIYLRGERVVFTNPMDAQRQGIAAIYQHATCFPDLTVAENIFIGHERCTTPFGRIDWKRMYADAQKLLDQLGARFSSRERMGALSVAQRQIVEIAKALSMNAQILIMDEPTAALTKHETEELYRIVKNLRESGISIIFISHRLEDIRNLADRITVFRDAKYIGCWKERELSQHDLIVAMVGREISQMFPKRKVRIGKEILRVEGLGRVGFFRGVSFNLHEGEILALTGLVGAGRTEVCEALFGIHPAESGRIYVDGKEVTIDSPITALQHGVGYLPEDRQQQGLILDWEIKKNITLPALRTFARFGLLQEEKENREAGKLAELLKVRAGSVYTPVSALSGGNQQKVVFAKILTRKLKVLMLDEPTKGVDVGAKAAIYEIIGDLAAEGYGILFVSSEMPEVLGLSDRVVVMREGHVTAILDTEQATQEQILNAAMVAEIPSPARV
ncbi:MAG: sugar ABC transporter ATP-binding protein [Spirochaetales bacterium]